MTNDHTDVLIVGGGVIGLAAAYYLNQAGRSVRLLEQRTIGSGASHGNCGIIAVSHAAPLTQPGAVRQGLKWLLQPRAPLCLRPTLNLRTISWLLHFASRCSLERMQPALMARAALLRSSRVLYDRLLAEEDLAAAVEWSASGSLFVCRKAATMAHLGSFFRHLEQLDITAKPLSGKALTKKEPALREDLAGAWHLDTDAHLRPDRLVAELHRLVVARGVRISENSEVLNVEADQPRRVTARTAAGAYAANRCLLATGAWSLPGTKPAGARLPIEPGKGYSITMSRPRSCPSHPCILEERHCVATPFQSGYRLGGTMEFAGYDSRLNQTRLSAIRQAATEYLREPEGETVEELWYGWRSMTYDGVPIIGRLPRFDNVFCATGHNMLGLSTATGTGKLISELITDCEPHLDPTPYCPDRF